MKILLIGDASNYHATLSRGLSAMGHDVTVASNGSRWMDTARNIDLSRRPGRIGGLILWTRLSTLLARRLRGYDVVQISNPIFIEQKPRRVRTLFDRLRRDNGAVFLTALGTDTAYVRMCTADDSPLRYSEWSVDGHRTPFVTSPGGIDHAKWLTNPLADHAQYVYDNVDGVVSALYEYHQAMKYAGFDSKRLAYGGIPINTADIPFTPPKYDGTAPLHILAPYHAGREAEKGTEMLYDAVRRLPNAAVDRVTGLKYDDFTKRLSASDIVLDQLYSYTPATTALVAMAMGKTVVTGAEADFETFIGDSVPAINVDPADTTKLTADIVRLCSPETMARRATAARDFVKRHNDTNVVARRFVDFWNKRL